MLLDALEAFAVDRAAAMHAYRLFVSLGRIALVPGKIELGVVIMVFFHKPIPGDFGNDGCSCD
jgi:hypothetical protein